VGEAVTGPNNPAPPNNPVISDTTPITLKIVLTVVSGVVFIALVAARGESNAKAIDELKAKQSTIDKIAIDVAVTRSKVETIEKEIGNK
jgi:hypothetical protein